VSFTVRRPSPLSRETSDTGTEDEIITGFDAMGFSGAKNPASKPTGPLVIPALENRDWRAAARKRQAIGTFVPESARAATGADGSVGGLGTRATINSGSQQVGLVMKSRSIEGDAKMEDEKPQDRREDTTTESDKLPEQLTEDERALRAILQGDLAEATIQIDVIPPTRSRTETEAYREDVVTLPDSATLDDYQRVPVDQFGAALLRGMGWKEGTSASRTRTGPVEPYLPEARPALLGIGAKERPPEDIPSGSAGASRKDGKRFSRPEKKYIPLRYESSSPIPRSSSSSRRPSRSPPPRTKHSERGGSDRDYDRDRSLSRRDSARIDDRRRDEDRERREREREGDRDREKGRDKYDDREHRKDGDKDRDRGRDRDAYQSDSRLSEKDR
ncbi:DExH-box splicing factor binding site-domain-containing protein, partial [Cantharellus anzutake]|uniref:DExH-box splicing factor binding site-domain-containing protein n=1 Tax=Cantharellus anzutake TaxID=1750568 RepID=UPI00190539DB